MRDVPEAEGRIDGDIHYVYGTIIRAHQHAAGSRGGTQQARPQAVTRVDLALRCICGPKETADS